MFSTCIYCSRSLGRNEAVEAFPVGERLAFDAARGRLWAVCPHCARWNLTPLEERWEAVEECERMTRGRRARAATDTVALYSADDGTALVRVGEAPPPEVAFWRYGRELRRRYLRAAVKGGVGAAAALGAELALARNPLALGAGAVGFLALQAFVFGGVVARRRSSVPVVGTDGTAYTVFPRDFDTLQLVGADAPGGWALFVKHSRGHFTLDGPPAQRALGRLLVQINGSGALPGVARAAAAEVGRLGASGLLAWYARLSVRAAGNYEEQLRMVGRAQHVRATPRVDDPYGERTMHGRYGSRPQNEGALPALAAERRLAIEMALHEASEQRAMELELAPLVAAWREAEEIAGIADGLLVPAAVDADLERLTRTAGGA